jgi:hypothetical protein
MIVVDAKRAQLLHAALGMAIDKLADDMSFKRAAPYRSAMALQMAEFVAEREKLAAFFPTLTEVARG